jgi:hypothetical protein
MIRIVLSFFAATLLTLGLGPSAAKAQARVFVAAQGSDSNPCSFALPCRTFQHAHDTVAANGEIDVLDPAGYGAVTITKSISIQGHGFSGISVASGTAITINAGASDKINLRGLLLDGVGTGSSGIDFTSGASLSIQDSLIRGFAINGVWFRPGSSISSKLYIADTLVSECDAGLAFNPFTPGSLPVSGVLERVQLNNNRSVGFLLTGPNINVAVSDSVVAHGTGDGIYFTRLGLGGVLMVRNTVISNNAGAGVHAQGDGATIRITRSTITGNGTGFASDNSGTLASYGDNNLAGNTADGAPTATIGLH